MVTGKIINTNKFDEYQIDNASKLKLKPVRTDNAQLLLLMENKIDDIDRSEFVYSAKILGTKK